MRFYLCNLRLMKHKINLIIVMMTACTALILGLQLYWTYQSYQSNARVFKSDISDALDKSVARLADLRRDEFASQYKKWMADTNLIVITAKLRKGETIYAISDKHDAPVKRGPFSMSIPNLPVISKITPWSKAAFINSFVKNMVYNSLSSGTSQYFTDALGNLLTDALAKDRPDTARLHWIYLQELEARDINSEFLIRQSKYTFNGFAADREKTVSDLHSTRYVKYPFGGKKYQLSAFFPYPNMFFVRKMKWIIITLVLLFAISISCFIYTVKTMLSQNKLTALKDDFVNNMTHELKTPVATIGIAAEAIQDFKVGEKAAAEYLRIIRQQTGHLTNLIDQILKSGNSGQHTQILRLENLDISELVAKSLRQFEPQLSELDAKIDLHAEPGKICISGDNTHLSNVLINILDNAVKYGNHPANITMSYRKTNNMALISVSNYGNFIPEEFRDKIFERFFRIPTGNLHNVKGYGLGLSYSREIIHQHHGTLALSTAENKTTFIIQIPLS